ncbi:MAG: methionine--tRNA ligase [Candidatus Zixiibacteriota bacterium]
MRKPFYITTPIYYVNDRPHIGHSYTTIAADLMTRFHRLNGREAFFLTGTDEHGTKVAEAAAAAGMDPQTFCDGVVTHFKDAWKLLSIEYDDFIRTTEERHIKGFQKILTILKDAKTDEGRDVVYSDTYEGLYCTGCEKFLTEKDLVNGVCPDHQKPPQILKEKNYFFRLNAYVDKVKELIESNELVILPDERRREVLGLLNHGLPDFSISRERVTWGIPLPFDPSQHAYVWIDALFNYVTGIGYGRDEAHFRKWWATSEIVHFMAKDILKFHCIFWPAMLLALKFPLPKTILLHGYFTIDGVKMSKSLGNQIPPDELVEQFGTDATRYLLLTQYPFGMDGDIKRSQLVTKYNSDLANDLGNLVSRVAKMIISNFGGALPSPANNLEGVKEIIDQSEGAVETSIEHYYNFRIGNAIEEAMNLVRLANKFFDANAPWKMVKDGKMKEAGGVLYTCAEVVRIVSILLYPTMPHKCLEILSIFGLGREDLSMDLARTFFQLKPGTDIAIEESVFPRLKDAGKEKKAEKPEKKDDDNLLEISEFSRVQLVVAQVLKAERVEGADKLLRMQIDVGDGKRQIVAGIAQHYTPEQMVGKKIVVVKNLKPAMIRGVESKGMLLAAKKGKELCVITPESDLPPGATIS